MLFGSGKTFAQLVCTNLLTSDVDWLVEDNPRCRLPAAGMRRRSFVCHVVIRFRQKTVKRNMSQISRLTLTFTSISHLQWTVIKLNIFAHLGRWPDWIKLTGNANLDSEYLQSFFFNSINLTVWLEKQIPIKITWIMTEIATRPCDLCRASDELVYNSAL